MKNNPSVLRETTPGHLHPQAHVKESSEKQTFSYAGDAGTSSFSGDSFNQGGIPNFSQGFQSFYLAYMQNLYAYWNMVGQQIKAFNELFQQQSRELQQMGRLNADMSINTRQLDLAAQESKAATQKIVAAS